MIPLKISIDVGDVKMKGVLKKTPLGEAVREALPLKGWVNRWGDEIYFTIPLHREISQGEGQTRMEVGDLAYWPAGRAFCIFFGPTPLGHEGEILAASDVEVFGHLISQESLLKEVQDGESILVEAHM